MEENYSKDDFAEKDTSFEHEIAGNDINTEIESGIHQSSIETIELTEPSINGIHNNDAENTDMNKTPEETQSSEEEIISSQSETPATEEIENLPETELVSEPVEEIKSENSSVEEISGESESVISETDETVSIDEEEPNDELQPEENFTILSREELVARLGEVVEHEDFAFLGRKVNQIKEVFYALTREEQNLKLEAFKETGGLPEEFEYVPDDLSVNFKSLMALYSKKRDDLRKKKEKEEAERIEQKKAIILELKGLLDVDLNIGASYNKINDLRTRWRSIGFVTGKESEDLWKTYNHYSEQLFQKININKELRDLDQKKNLELKTELCEKAEKLIIEPSIRKSIDQLQELQEIWKSTGHVAREVSDTLWERFKSAGDKIHERRRGFVEDLKAVHNTNYEAKLKLCEEIEAFLDAPKTTNKEWTDAAEKVTSFLNEWKKIGFANKSVNDVIWKRFKTAKDSFYKAKDDFFDSHFQEAKHNMKIRMDLILEAEAIKDSTDWKETADLLKGLQIQWKNAGAVPHKKGEKLWLRFRAACDHFFNKKNQHFSGVDEVQKENLRLKTELIERINNFELGDKQDHNIDQLRRFQSEWMEILHVPMKEKDRIHQEYRKALDSKFTGIQTNFGDRNRSQNPRQGGGENRSNSGPREPRNTGEQRSSGGSNDAQDKIKKLQTEVNQLENNLGFLGRSKNADTLRADYQKQIDKTKEEIAKLVKAQK